MPETTFQQPVSYWPRNTHNVVDFSQGDFDRQQVGVETDWNPTPLPVHHTHQVMYVCHGQCTGPQCDFSRRSKQWHSMTYLDGGDPLAAPPPPPEVGFRSEVVEMTPIALRKLDQKKESLSRMKQVLASKLESKAAAAAASSRSSCGGSNPTRTT